MYYILNHDYFYFDKADKLWIENSKLLEANAGMELQSTFKCFSIESKGNYRSEGTGKISKINGKEIVNKKKLSGKETGTIKIFETSSFSTIQWLYLFYPSSLLGLVTYMI